MSELLETSHAAETGLSRRNFLTACSAAGLANTLLPGALLALASQSASAQTATPPAPLKFTPAMVDVAAARGKDGKLVLSIINTDPNHAVQVVTNLTGTAHGRILTAFAMDAHNTFDAPNLVHPLAFSSSTEGGKMSFDMPAKAVAVASVD